MKYCDTTPSILKWSSEEIAIPYKSPVDNRVHRYVPDFYVKVRESSGKIVHKLIEVKPSKQTTPPKTPQSQTPRYISEVREYAKNIAQWKAGNEFCKDRLWKFQVLTEHELGIK